MSQTRLPGDLRSPSQKSLLLFADSRNRDIALYPSGNSYVLHLTSPIKNIERVDLVSARLANSLYNISLGSNIISVGTSNISLNPGFYSVYTLAQAVTNTNLITLEYLPQEGHMIFSSPTNFTIKLNTSEISQLIGLPQNQILTATLATTLDPTYIGKYILKSTSIVNMSTTDLAVLDIDELRTPFHMDTGSLQGTSGTISGKNVNRSFGPIVLDVGTGCYKTFEENKDYCISINYPEPIRSLQRLTISWLDTDGKPLDFRGLNNNTILLRLHLTPDPEPTLPPPEPLEEIQIKRIVEAMKIQPPPPPEPKRRFHWWIIILVLLGAFVAYKTFGGQLGKVGPVPVPGPVRLGS
jgi:hypothetical protein